MNKYELTLVLDAKKGAALKKKVTETVESLVKVFKGKVVESKDWGTKEMAYRVNKVLTGTYLFFELELPPLSVKSINDKLRIDKEIMRFLLVRKD